MTEVNGDKEVTAEIDFELQQEVKQRIKMAQSILKNNKKQEILVYSEGESECEFEIPYKDLKETA